MGGWGVLLELLRPLPGKILAALVMLALCAVVFVFVFVHLVAGPGEISFSWINGIKYQKSGSQPETWMGKIRGGRTKPGDTKWKSHTDSGGSGFKLEIDTRAAKFTRVPLYFVTLAGNNAVWGATLGVYRATAEGFELHVLWRGKPITVEEANDMKWHIHWLGVEQPADISP